MGSKPETDPTAGRKKKYSKKTPIKLGYWNIRGMAQPIRYMLEYSEHPYEEIKYEQGDAPDYSPKAWTDVKDTLGLPFPNMPYLIDDELKITDPYAMGVYIANAFAPELLGKTPDEIGVMDVYYTTMKQIK